MSRLSDELALSEDPVAQFTETLIEIANQTIPKSHISKNKLRKVLWFTMFVNKLLKNVRKLNGNICNAFAKKEHVLAIFFDLEKAYDATWKHGILSHLYDLDFRGHLPTFIDGFLSHRLFQVRAGSTMSDTYEQEMGVPQGSILSPVLFSLFFSVLKLTILSSQS